MSGTLPRVVGVAEVAKLWRVNRQRVNVLVASSDFPSGEHLTAGRVWAFWDVIEWSVTHGRRCYPVEGYPDPAGPAQ